MLNNHAFGYRISVPVHIILRSGGSVTTMAVGWLWGRRFSRVQIVAVAMLTVGVVVAAMGDAKPRGKGKPEGDASDDGPSSKTFLAGLAILFLAQLLSAIMGLYIQFTYEQYGKHWRENLFYSHLLSLPLFLPFSSTIITQFRALAASAPLTFSPLNLLHSTLPPTLIPHLPLSLLSKLTLHIPSQLINLLLNAITQILCITGVNLLSARASALTVTIVLNLRKLVSLLISLFLFGNELSSGVPVGAIVVFGGGLVYAWEGNRLRLEKKGETMGIEGKVMNGLVGGEAADRTDEGNGTLQGNGVVKASNGHVGQEKKEL